MQLNILQCFNFDATRTSTSTSPLKSVPSHVFVPGTQGENLIPAAQFSQQCQSGGRFWPAAKRRRFLFCGSSSSGMLSSSSAATGSRAVLGPPSLCACFPFLPPALFLKVSPSADVCYSCGTCSTASAGLSHYCAATQGLNDKQATPVRVAHSLEERQGERGSDGSIASELVLRAGSLK